MIDQQTTRPEASPTRANEAKLLENSRAAIARSAMLLTKPRPEILGVMVPRQREGNGTSP